jgi:hypothetical protein
MSRKRPEADDLTFAGMSEADTETRAIRGPKGAAAPPPDPWEAVAAECPVKASPAAHKAVSGDVRRVHVKAYGQPVLCLPGRRGEGRRFLPDLPLPAAHPTDPRIVFNWVRTMAFSIAEDFA